MPSNRDIIDRLRHEVIRLDPEGQWLKDFINRPDSFKHPVAGAKAAMEEVLASGFSLEDLGSIGRYVRWTSCGGTLYKLDDPGLEDSKLAGLHEALAAGPHRVRREQEFFEQLAVDGYWSDKISDFAAGRWNPCVPEADDKTFPDALVALERLRAQGITNQTLKVMEDWHYYETVYHTLRLVEEHYEKAEEVSGLDHHVPCKDPARWDSRPIATLSPQGAEDKHHAMPDPVLLCHGVEKFAFSPDSRLIAICGKTAPIRIIDIQDGREIAVCRALKGEVYSAIVS